MIYGNVELMGGLSQVVFPSNRIVTVFFGPNKYTSRFLHIPDMSTFYKKLKFSTYSKRFKLMKSDRSLRKIFATGFQFRQPYRIYH